MWSRTLFAVLAFSSVTVQAIPGPLAAAKVRVANLQTFLPVTYTITSTYTQYDTLTFTATSIAVNSACPDATRAPRVPRAPVEAVPTITRDAHTNDAYVTVFSTVLATASVTTTEVFTPPCPQATEPPTIPGRCSEGKVKDLLIFDDFGTPVAGHLSPSPFEYKGFTFTDGWELANCEDLDGYQDQTCNPDTVEGDEFLSLFGPAIGTKPIWRRIAYDYDNEDTGFDLLSFYVSTPPSLTTTSAADFRSIIYCGWSLADQYNEVTPTWCKTKYLNQPDNTSQLISLSGADTVDLAFIEIVAIEGQQQVVAFGDVVDYARAKGSLPIEVLIDNIEVCVPA